VVPFNAGTQFVDWLPLPGKLNDSVMVPALANPETAIAKAIVVAALRIFFM